MKKESKDPMDQYFREILSSPDLKYDNSDWKKMELLLRPSGKRRKIAVWYWLSGAAAVLLLFFSVWLFRGIGTGSDDPASGNKSGKNNLNNPVKPAPADSTVQALKTGPDPKNPITLNKAVKPPGAKPLTTSPAQNNQLRIEAWETAPAASVAEPLPASKMVRVNSTTGLPATGAAPVLAAAKEVRTTAQAAKPAGDNEAEQDDAKQNRWAVSFSVLPDLNTVDNFRRSSFGGGAGVGISYRLNKNLALSTGVAYAKKSYSSSPDAYKANGFYPRWLQNSSAVNGDCRVLDVPLNLNYLLSSGKGRKFIFSAGLSSYIMLKEKYTYIGGGGKPYPGQPVADPNPSYTLQNQNEHVLGVVTLGAGVVKPLGKQSTLSIQPYAKLPVTGIGQGRVNLKTFGVSLQMNVNPKRK